MKLYGSIFLLSASIRIACGLFLLSRAESPTRLEFPDEEQYWGMAHSYRSGAGLRDELGFQATRMPLYPGLLALAASLENGVVVAKVFQWGLGAFQAVFAAALAARIADRRTAWLAGIYVGFDPFLVFFTNLLLTETLFTTLIAGLWLFVIRDGREPIGSVDATSRGSALEPIAVSVIHRLQTGATPTYRDRPLRDVGDSRSPETGTADWYGWIGLTATAVAALYTRESAVLLLLMAAGCLVLRSRFNRRQWYGVAAVSAVTTASLLPWAIRNRQTIGEWCILTTRGGISLFDGVGPQATGASDLGAVKQMPAVAGMSEGDWNRYFLKESFRALRDQPVRVLALAGVKLKRTWNPFPNVETYRRSSIRWMAAAWAIPTFGLALIGAWVLYRGGPSGRWSATVLLMPALYVTLLHCVFVGSMRYRIPALPFLDILAVIALSRCWAARSNATASPADSGGIEGRSTSETVQHLQAGSTQILKRILKPMALKRRAVAQSPIDVWGVPNVG